MYHFLFPRILCKCQELAKKSDKKYVMLGLQYYGECWATESTMGRVLPMHSNDCFDEIFKKCHSGSAYCAGTDKTTVLYELSKWCCFCILSQKSFLLCFFLFSIPNLEYS